MQIKNSRKEGFFIICGLIIGIILCWIVDSSVEANVRDREIIQLVESLTRKDRVKSTFANVILFILGRGVLENWLPEEKRGVKWILAFPTGMLLWSGLSIVFLLVGIPYNRIVMLSSVLLLLAISWIALFRKKIDIGILIRDILFFGVVVVILSAGFLRNIIGNDTTYFNQNYGYWLAKEGGFTDGLIVPMLTTGLSTATLCSYFSMQGIDNMYLAQNIFRCLFILIFYWGIQTFCESNKNKVIGIIGTILLLTSPAYALVSSWMVSNSFMMFELFIFVICLRKIANGVVSCVNLASILALVAAFTRVEGSLMILFFVVCAMVMQMGRNQLNRIIIPTIVGQTIYQIRCVLFNRNVANELFLSYDNVIILISFMVAVFAIVQVKDMKWLKGIMSRIHIFILIGGVLGTIGLCILDYEKYRSNFVVFGRNVTYLGKTGSWGMTPLLFVICVILIICRWEYNKFLDTLWIGYIIFTFAICWSRESALRISIADSGNRILIQVIPIMILALMWHFEQVVMEKGNKKNIE